MSIPVSRAFGAFGALALAGMLTLAPNLAVAMGKGKVARVVYIQANPRGSNMPAVTYPDPATANSKVAPSLPMAPSYHAGPYVGALSAPPPRLMHMVYPTCGGATQDECRNPRGW